MFKRLSSLLLMLALIVALLPLNVGAALAEDAADEADMVDELVPELDEFMIGVDEGADDALPENLPEDEGDFAVAAPLPEDESEFAVAAPLPMAVSHSVSITQSGSIVTIKGSVPSPYQLFGIIVDGTEVSNKLFGSSINQTVNMDSGTFATGYHTVYVGIGQWVGAEFKHVDTVIKKYMVTNTFKDRPTYGGVFDVYSNYFDIYPFQMTAFGYLAPKLFLEYSADGGKTWSRSGSMKPGGIKVASQESYRISGLKPGTTYNTRLRYGDYVTYATGFGGDGKSYFFGGPVLNTATITTGMGEAPKIKSVTCKATKIKYHKIKQPGYYNYAGGKLFWHKAWTEKFYTCNVKVTVKLKKKPGTNGVWITFDGQRKWVKGNKKTYSATFTSTVNYFAKKPKGRYKFNVSVCSGQDSAWGGFSPSWSKTKKLAK